MPTSTNERIAREVMGWPVVQDGSGQWWFEYPGGRREKSNLPDFEHSLDACRIAEDEIERRGLMEDYAYELERLRVHSFKGVTGPSNLTWWLIRLTPAQRCKAMIAVVEEPGKGNANG